MYRQNDVNQIVEGHHTAVRLRAPQATGWDDLPPSLRPHKDEFGRPLGIYTKSLVAPSKRVHDFILQDQSCKLLPKHRVCNCLKKRIDKNKNRTVKYNVDRKKSHWSNVQRCASLWVCPVCAKQITEGRRSELSAALERWKKILGGCLLLTLTFSHSLDMPLAVTQLGLRKAYQYFVEHRQVKNIFEFLGVQHKIKGQEITWGKMVGILTITFCYSLNTLYMVLPLIVIN